MEYWRKRGGFCKKTRKNKDDIKKNSKKIWRIKKKSVPLQSQSRNKRLQYKIGIWCNGNTADSGPAFPGSSPGIPTKRNLPHGKFLLFSSNNAFLSLSITASTMFILSACWHNLWYHYLCALCAFARVLSRRCLLHCIFLAKPQRSQGLYTLVRSLYPLRSQCMFCAWQCRYFFTKKGGGHLMMSSASSNW